MAATTVLFAIETMDVTMSGQKMNVSENQHRWRYDIVAFAREVCGAEPWDQQADFLREAVRNHRVALKSGHKVSKTNSLAILALHWAICCDGQVLLASPTRHQVKHIAWPEVCRLADHARTTGLVDLPEPASDPAVGIRWSDGRRIVACSTEIPERLSGVGGEKLLCLLEEAARIPRSIYEMLRDSGSCVRFVLTGTPMVSAGILHDAFTRDQELWHLLTISSLDTPNVKTGKTITPGLATRDWCDMMLNRHDQESDIYRTRVLGEFASTEHI